MSYSCLEELQVSLNLNLSDKTKILSNAGCKYDDNWFIVTDDGNCHLFDNDGNLDDIAKVEFLCIKLDIKKIIVPCNVTTIGSYAFYNCSSLTSVMIPNRVTSIGRYAFYKCSCLTSLMIPNSVREIGYCAFVGCTRLTSVTIGNGITHIKPNAFDDCNNLKSFAFKGKTLEEVQSMKNYP